MQYMRKENKTLEEANHLCQALHIARRKQDNNGVYYFTVTDAHPHTCDKTSTISTKGSRKSPFTTKHMSLGIRDIFNRDKFHTVDHIGQFVETEMHLPSNQLEYQQRFWIRNLLKEESYGSTHWQYMTLVSRLEIIKKNDPDSLILLKVFADNIEVSMSKIILQKIGECSDQTTGLSLIHISEPTSPY